MTRETTDTCAHGTMSQQSRETDEREIMRLLRACECVDVEANEVRAVQGAAHYGALDIDRDPRDFVKEANEELLDARFYLAAECIRLRRYMQTHALSFYNAPHTLRAMEEHLNALLSAILTIDATMLDIRCVPITVPSAMMPSKVDAS